MLGAGRLIANGAGNRRGRRRGEQRIPAGLVETAGQRIKQRHRTRRLRHVGVLLVTAPRVIGHRARVLDQPRRHSICVRGIQQIASTASGGYCRHMRA